MKTEGRPDNISYTQAGVSCFVGKESAKFKVQFFVGSSVVKKPACVKLNHVMKYNKLISSFLIHTPQPFIIINHYRFVVYVFYKVP